MYKFSCGHMFSVLSGLGVELLCLFMKNCHTVFQSDCTILYSHQQCIKVPVLPYTYQCLLVPVFHILVNTDFLNYNYPRRQWQPTPVLLPAVQPLRLQSMGTWRVGHNWVTSLSLFTFMHWRRKWQPTPVFLPGESQGWGSLVGYCLWGRTESDGSDLAAAAVIKKWCLVVFICISLVTSHVEHLFMYL